MAFPLKIRDPELGEVEWISSQTPDEVAEQINERLQETIDFVEDDEAE